MSLVKITLKSSDGVPFQVDRAVAKHMIRDYLVDNEILLPNVRSEILAKVIEYCKKHAESANPDDEEVKAWDAEFVRLDPDTLSLLQPENLLLDSYGSLKILRKRRTNDAAKDFKIQGLMDLTGEAIADLIRGKTTEQIRETFKIREAPKARKYGSIMSWMLVVSLVLVAGYSTRKRWGLGQSR